MKLDCTGATACTDSPFNTLKNIYFLPFQYRMSQYQRKKKRIYNFGRTVSLLNGHRRHRTCFWGQQPTTSKSWFHAHVPGIEGDAECNWCTWIMHRRSLFKDKILIRASPQGPAGCLPRAYGALRFASSLLLGCQPGEERHQSSGWLTPSRLTTKAAYSATVCFSRLSCPF